MVGTSKFLTSYATLYGQEKAKKIVSRMFHSGRLSHAYLFRGPDGVGKQLCAKLFAAHLNCQSPAGDGGCGVCPSCRKFLSGNHPDILVVSPENGTIKIDRIRELCRSLTYPPYESAVRVVILEDIHTMRPEAANSLLKTLEEPPENNVLILTAELSREILPTIISRCQTVPFYGLSTSQTIEVLRGQFPDLGDVEADILARLSDGSPGKALLLKERDLIDTWNMVRRILEEPCGADGCSIGDVLQAAEVIASLKDDLAALLGLMRIWVRDNLVEPAEVSVITRDEQVARLAALDSAERYLARNCNRTLVCEVLLFNLQSPLPRVSL